MSGRHDATPLPGSWLHRVARRLLDPNTVRFRIEPAIADLQHEARASAVHGVKGALLLRRGYAACVVVILVNVLSGGMRMWTPSRTWLAAAACCTLAALVLIGARFAFPYFVFGLISAGLVLPLVEMAATAGARWSLRRALILASAAVPLGYVAGGLVGWAHVPSAWTASLSITIDASMNAATYGGAFEHSAERALDYFLVGGTGGALALAVLAVAGTRIWEGRIGGAPAPGPGCSRSPRSSASCRFPSCSSTRWRAWPSVSAWPSCSCLPGRTNRRRCLPPRDRREGIKAERQRSCDSRDVTDRRPMVSRRMTLPLIIGRTGYDLTVHNERAHLQGRPPSLRCGVRRSSRRFGGTSSRVGVISPWLAEGRVRPPEASVDGGQRERDSNHVLSWLKSTNAMG